jgi:hypothetical protein
MDSHISVTTAPWFGNLRAIEVGSLSKTAHQMRFAPELALLWQIFAADERDGIPKSVFQ